MWSGGKDIVDQIFDTGYWVVSKSVVLGDEIRNHVGRSIESINEKISNRKAPPVQESNFSTSRQDLSRKLKIGFQDHWKLAWVEPFCHFPLPLPWIPDLFETTTSFT